ncbi:hypothetical protein [Chamaesiphon sp. OTE_8_metabat_110]|uniref:hypothetical protein n=1 Tax=Chamaesiphon sp. OTE_8_metabat_110 TaxID=2964696 RepID=UPI00286D3751|nr:hypothetical protein [Chamaesiphon sp. OTE_8_metabat_110]
MISEKSPKSNIFELDDRQLIEKFIQGSKQLLASDNLRLEVNGGLSQLLARNGDPLAKPIGTIIAIMYLHNTPRTVIVKHGSPFLELIDRLLIERDFVMFGDASRAGFIEYKHYVTPAGYRIWHTEPSILWKKWWPTERFQDKQRFNMNILVSFKNNWYPVQHIVVSAGTFTVKTIAGQLVLKRDDKVLWLAQVMQEQASELTGHIQPEIAASDPHPIAEVPPQTDIDLVAKIQQKQQDIQPDQSWTIIKKLEQKLQAQLRLNGELSDKFNHLESRAIVAEQRLQIIYKYLQEIGVEPRDIYNGGKKVNN